LAGAFDAAALVHPWTHPEPEIDRLQKAVEAVAAQSPNDRRAVFERVCELAGAGCELEARPRITVPYLTEPWYC
jgi:hypothetical protein